MKEMRRIKTWISRMYIAYLELVYRTSQVELVSNTSDQDYSNCIMGFWHGECCCNYLLFKHMEPKNLNLDLIVTAGPRGDYIEKICNHYKVNVLRIPDGMGIKGYLNYIKKVANLENRSLIVALDGPAGPVHQPKKLSFMLSNQSNKSFVRIHTEVKRKVRLFKRWDRYIIPLPYNKITFHIDKIDSISKEQLSNFPQLQKWCSEGRTAE